MRTKQLVLTALFAALTAIGAFLKIQIPVEGIPAITLQFFFTAMAGVLLGAKYGAISQAVYVLLGLVGLPIFTMGGGFSYVLQPSFGFLLGLIPSAWVIGILCKNAKSFWPMALGILAGLAVLYLIGTPSWTWLPSISWSTDLPRSCSRPARLASVTSTPSSLAMSPAMCATSME